MRGPGGRMRLVAAVLAALAVPGTVLVGTAPPAAAAGELTVELALEPADELVRAVEPSPPAGVFAGGTYDVVVTVTNPLAVPVSLAEGAVTSESVGARLVPLFGGVLTSPATTLAPGASEDIRFTRRALQQSLSGQDLVVTAAVDGTVPDGADEGSEPDPVSGTASRSFGYVPAAVVSLHQGDVPTPGVLPGEPVELRVTIANTGLPADEITHVAVGSLTEFTGTLTPVSYGDPPIPLPADGVVTLTFTGLTPLPIEQWPPQAARASAGEPAPDPGHEASLGFGWNTRVSVELTTTRTSSLGLQIPTIETGVYIEPIGLQPRPAPGDLDNDGRSDIAVYRPSTGRWYVLGTSGSTAWGAAGDIPVPGHYDFGGGTHDRFATFRPSSGRWYVHGAGQVPTVGAAGDIPVPGSYYAMCAGCGLIVRPGTFRPSDGTWRTRGDLDVVTTTQFGTTGDLPVPGDWDNDPATDLAVYRRSSGRWYVHGTVGSTQFGTPTDIPVPGYWDEDPLYDLAVFRPATGRWYIAGQPTSTHWGQAGDIPVPGNWDDEDPQWEIAVFRPSNGRWYVLGQPSVAFGTLGDVPLVAAPAALL